MCFWMIFLNYQKSEEQTGIKYTLCAQLEPEDSSDRLWKWLLAPLVAKNCKIILLLISPPVALVSTFRHPHVYIYNQLDKLYEISYMSHIIWVIFRVFTFFFEYFYNGRSPIPIFLAGGYLRINWTWFWTCSSVPRGRVRNPSDLRPFIRMRINPHFQNPGCGCGCRMRMNFHDPILRKNYRYFSIFLNFFLIILAKFSKNVSVSMSHNDFVIHTKKIWN